MGPFPSGAPDSSDSHVPESPRGFASGQDFKVILNPQNVILDANPIAARLLGVPRERLFGAPFASFFCNPEAVAVLRATGPRKSRLVELNSAEGERMYLLAKTRSAGDSNLLVSARRIGRREGSNSAAVDRLDRFRIAFEFASMGVGLVDLDGNFFETNRTLASLFGYSRQELETMNLLDVWIPEERAEAYEEFEAASRGGKAEAVYERRYRSKQGEMLYVEVSRGLARDDAGKPLFFVISFRDITESKRLQGMLAERVYTDPLTGTMNRNGIEERVGYEFSRSDRYGAKPSLVMIDLDHFKAVNDTYGHLAGDRVLRAFADIARSCLRSTDMLGRWGGEEFVALLPETGLDGAELFCERLRSTLHNFRFEGEIQLRVSMGVVVRWPGEAFDALVGRADGCLYRAKREGRDRVVVDSQDRERESGQPLKNRHPALLHWRPAHECGHPQIDAEHRELFRLANLMIEFMTEKVAADGLVPVARELVAHVAEHFHHEEELLQACGYAEAGAHGAAHRRLLSRAGKLVSGLEAGQGTAAELLGFLLYDLVARHMLVEDRKFLPWLKAGSEPRRAL